MMSSQCNCTWFLFPLFPILWLPVNYVNGNYEIKTFPLPRGWGDKLVLGFDHWVGFYFLKIKTQIQKHTINCSMMVILNVPISTLISHDINKIRIPSRTTMALDYCPPPSYVNFWGLHNFASTKIKHKIKTEWTQTKLQLQLFSEFGWLVLAAV